MNARFAHVLSRLSIVSMVAVSGLGASACNNRAPTAAAPAAAVEAEAAPAATSEHTPGRGIFRQVEALDLRPEQRASLGEIEQNLRADLEPHRETLRQVAGLLASGVESGRLDPSDAAAQQAALQAAALDAKDAFANAMNAVHDALDAGQRAELVAKLQEMHLHGHARAAGQEGAEPPRGPLAKLAFELGLTEEQKANIRDAVQKGVEEIFPDRKARREASEARMKAMADAFVSDDFDAAELDLSGGAERSLESFAAVAGRAIDVSGSVLSDSQRQVLASMIREHAQRL